MTLTPSAQFAVQLPSGEFAELIPGSHINTHLGPIELPGFDVLYLDITNQRGFRIAGQANVDPRDVRRGTWEWNSESGQWATVSDEAPGIYPVIYDADSELEIATPAHNGSQGWRYLAENGELVTGDATLNAPRWNATRTPHVSDLWEFSYLGGVFFGQGETGCDVLIDGTRRRLLDGDTHNIRVRFNGTTWGVGLSRFRENDAARWVLTRANLEALPLVTQSPIPTTPNPETPRPEPVMPAAPNVFPQIQAVFRAHPEINTLEEGERGRMTDHVVIALGGRPWGRKDRDQDPENHNNSDDALCYLLPDGRFEIYDIISGSDGGPTWDYKGTFANGENGYFRDVVAPQPTPVPTPGQPKPPSQPKGFDALIAETLTPLYLELAAQKAQIAALKVRIETLQAQPAPSPSPAFPSRIALKTAHGKYVCAEGDGRVVADRDGSGPWETFEVEAKE